MRARDVRGLQKPERGVVFEYKAFEGLSIPMLQKEAPLKFVGNPAYAKGFGEAK